MLKNISTIEKNSKKGLKGLVIKLELSLMSSRSVNILHVKKQKSSRQSFVQNILSCQGILNCKSAKKEKPGEMPGSSGVFDW